MRPHCRSGRSGGGQKNPLPAEKLTVMQFEVCRFVTPCSFAVGYQRFRGPCCLHLQGEVLVFHRISSHLSKCVSLHSFMRAVTLKPNYKYDFHIVNRWQFIVYLHIRLWKPCNSVLYKSWFKCCRHVGSLFLFLMQDFSYFPVSCNVHIASCFLLNHTQRMFMEPSFELLQCQTTINEWKATSWMIGGSNPGRILEFFSSPPCPDRLWGPPSLLANGYQRLFP
jgi:hypothetical protein